MVGSVMMTTDRALSFPLGVGAAVYLEEYAPDNAFGVRHAHRVNIANLAGVPSVVYGLLGLALFVRVLLAPGDRHRRRPRSRPVHTPYRDHLRAGGDPVCPRLVPAASYGMGATRWQTIRRTTFPTWFRAFGGVTILALLFGYRRDGSTADEWGGGVGPARAEQLLRCGEYDAPPELLRSSDRHGKAANAVLDTADEFTIVAVAGDDFVTSRIDDGEAGISELR